MVYAKPGDKVWIRPHLFEGDNEEAVVTDVGPDGIVVRKNNGVDVRSPWTMPYYVHDPAHKRHDVLFPVWFPRSK